MKLEGGKVKKLIAYFSRADQNYFNGELKNIEVGNTEVAAKYIQAYTGADVFKIEPLKPYSKEYNECIAQAKDDLQRKARPELKQYLPDLSEYDEIYLGYPNYWGTMPMCVFTFLEHYDLKGKKIYPFCTHEGSGLARSENDIKSCCDAKVMPGLAIHGSDVKQSQEKIQDWLGGKSND